MDNKRDSLKKLLRISAFVSVLPNAWFKPVINSVALPAHAQTSVMAPENETLVSEISGPEIIEIGINHTYSITVADKDGISSVSVRLDCCLEPPELVDVSGETYSYTIPNNLQADEIHVIEFSVIGLKSNGSPDNDNVITRSLRVEVNCPPGQVVGFPFGNCQPV